MKVSKKLLSSIVCFIASVAVFIGVCFAWFVSSEGVNVEGMFTGVAGSSIEEFSVNAYLLDYASSTDQLAFVKNSSTALTDKSSMRPYNQMSADCTTILIELNLTVFSSNESGYVIGVESQTSTDLSIQSTADGKLDSFTWFLSNAVYLQQAELNSKGQYVAKSTQTYAFIDIAANKKNTFITLNEGVLSGADGATSTTLYYLMDYNDESINTYLSSKAVENGGGLNTKTYFITDSSDFIFTVYQNG